MLIKEKIDEKIEKEIDKLKDSYIEVQGTVSNLRKKGKNTEIAEILLIDIPAKIKMVGITQDIKDVGLTERAIEKIKNEINDIVNGSDFDHINELIQESFEHLRKGEKQLAINKYSQIMSLYKLLTGDLKKTVYRACKKLRKDLSRI